jgi:tryptophan-rich sensory protein
MDEAKRPGVVRFLIYLIGAASLAGGLAGWVLSSGGMNWAENLSMPNWTPSARTLVLSGIVMLHPLAISLWITQRGGRDGMRALCSLLILGLIGGFIAWLIVFFGARDVTSTFLANLAGWTYALFVTGLVGRCSSAAGYLLWPVFVWQTLNLALSFEIMRLNSGGGFAGGL